MPQGPKRKGGEMLVYMLVCAGLLVWAVHDAWFPSPATIEKHPRSMEHYFKTNGVIDSFSVTTGSVVRAGEEMATLVMYPYMREMGQLQREAARLQKKQRDIMQGGDAPVSDSFKNTVARMIEENRARQEEIRAEAQARVLKSSIDGRVERIMKAERDFVKSDEPVIVVDPRDSFYLFNKILAFLSLTGLLVLAYLYKQWYL